MSTGGRTAAKITGVAAAAGLVFGMMGPAFAASQVVEYRLDSGSVTINETTYALPDSTGIEGTWDDATGDFTGVFRSSAVPSQQAVTSPVVGTIDLTTEFVGTTDVTGTIDPATGDGSLGLTMDVVITLQSLSTAPDVPPVILDQVCTIANVPVSYSVTATGLGADSEIFTNLALTAAPFAAPAATCVAGPAGNPALTPIIQENINTTVGLPTQDTASVLSFVAGAIPPPPPSTTTTTGVTTTTASDLKNCDDFQYRDEAQAVLDADRTDPNQLDGDGNGQACENLPVRPAPAVTATVRFTG